MIGDKKILAITLARGGSKRVYKKNMANLNGVPLLKYTTDEVKKSKYIDHYIRLISSIIDILSKSY